jgi:SAM-dependent methyltransferase
MNGIQIVLSNFRRYIMSQFKWHETAEKQWDEKSTLWNKNSQEMWDIGSRSSIVPFIQKHIQFGKRNEVNLLDLGCGDGYGSWKLYNAGYDVTGIDLSKEMVDLANKRCEEEQIDFIQSDLVTLPFENESFQAVTAINSFEWTEVPVNAILEMKRVLMNGGQACVGINRE